MEYIVIPDNGKWTVYRKSLALTTPVARYRERAAADTVAYVLNLAKGHER